MSLRDVWRLFRHPLSSPPMSVKEAAAEQRANKTWEDIPAAVPGISMPSRFGAAGGTAAAEDSVESHDAPPDHAE